MCLRAGPGSWALVSYSAAPDSLPRGCRGRSPFSSTHYYSCPRLQPPQKPINTHMIEPYGSHEYGCAQVGASITTGPSRPKGPPGDQSLKTSPPGLSLILQIGRGQRRRTAPREPRGRGSRTLTRAKKDAFTGTTQLETWGWVRSKACAPTARKGGLGQPAH